MTLRLEGRLAGASIDELERSCERLLARDARIVVDVASVSFVDRTAIPRLRALRARGVRFRNGNGFVTEQLKEVEQR